MLQLQSIPRTTLDVLKTLAKQPFIHDFYLVGGTALSLYWGHRLSEDIDLFTERKVNLDKLEEEIASIKGAQMDSKNPIGRTYTINGIKCDFLNYPYPFLYPPFISDELQLANINDVVSLKLGAIANRGAKKDLYDLYYILQKYSMEQLLKLYQQKYNVTDVFPLLKSLTYFNDAEDELPPKLLIAPFTTWYQVEIHSTKSKIRIVLTVMEGFVLPSQFNTDNSCYFCLKQIAKNASCTRQKNLFYFRFSSGHS